MYIHISLSLYIYICMYICVCVNIVITYKMNFDVVLFSSSQMRRSGPARGALSSAIYLALVPRPWGEAPAMAEGTYRCLRKRRPSQYIAIYSDMRFDSYFAGCNAYPYLSLYSGMAVFFADTGTPASTWPYQHIPHSKCGTVSNTF